MKWSKFTDEQILAIVKESEGARKAADLVGKGSREDVQALEGEGRRLELSEKQRLKQVEDENRRLKQIVAEQTLDIQALKAVVAKKW